MIDTSNPVPYHLQIRDMLAEEIKRGFYKEKIPSERELMKRFSVSRTTIREAISHLVKDGLLEKIHGKGTFIAQKRPVHDWLDSLSSLTATIKKMGMEPGARLLDSGIVVRPSYISHILKVDSFYKIERLRTADGIPIAIERHYYDKNIGFKLASFDLETTTIYDLLENELKLDMEEAEQFISCKEVTKDDALQLEVKINSSVLSVERLIRDGDGIPIEYYTSNFRPDMYIFRMRTKRKK